MGATTMTAPPGSEFRRRETTASIGLIIGLGSGTMMFLALFAALWMVRLNTEHWPPPGVSPLPLFWPSVNTAVLLLSSIVLHLGVRAFARQDVPAYRRRLLATLGLGVVFVALQVVVWLELWDSGFRLVSGNYAAFFYVLTAFHAAHVLAGLLVLAWIVPQVRTPAGHPRRGARVRLSAVFWHFVDVVWVCLFVMVYVL